MLKKCKAGIVKKAILKILNAAWDERRFNYGMTQEEIHNMLKLLGLHRRTFWKWFGIGHTCAKDNSGEILYYYCDIEEVLAYEFEYRDIGFFQGD